MAYGAVQDPICGAGGRHVVYPGARFCARCGGELAGPRPLTWPDGPASPEPAPLDPLPWMASLTAWTAAQQTLFAVTHDGASHRLLSLPDGASPKDLGSAPDISELVAPMLASRRGVFLVYPEGVRGALAGGPLLSWEAPSGSRLTGAAVSGAGELWVAAVHRDGGLTLLTPSAAAPGQWREGARLPGFGGDPQAFLFLAVRSRGQRSEEALVWGNGKAAVIFDRAAPVLRQQLEAPALPARLRQRRSARAAIIAQAPWREDRPLLVPAGERSVRLLRLAGAELSANDFKLGAEPVFGAALTASGALCLRLSDQVRVFEPPFQVSTDVRTGRSVEEVVGACALQDAGLFQEHESAAGPCRPLLASLQGVRDPWSGRGAEDERAIPLAPPILWREALWYATRRGEATSVRRQPLRPVPSHAV
jgi:hypothetical protein